MLAAGGGGNTAVFVLAERHHRRRHQEPGMGAAHSRQDQGAQRQAGDDDHQHAHARRSRQRQRGVPGDRRRRGAGEHRGEHEEDGAGTGLSRRPPPNIFTQNNGKGLPKRTFKRPDDDRQAATIRSTCTTSGAVTRTATPGCSSRRCASCHAGDIFSGKNSPAPRLRNNGGSAVEIPDTLSKAHSDAQQESRTPSSPATAQQMTHERSARVRRFQPRVPERRSSGKEGRQDRGRVREERGRCRPSTPATRRRNRRGSSRTSQIVYNETP